MPGAKRRLQWRYAAPAPRIGHALFPDRRLKPLRERADKILPTSQPQGLGHLLRCRIRAIGSNWKRVERQRKVIIAVIDKLKASGFAGLDALAEQVLPHVQTNFTQLELIGLLLYAPTFLNVSVEQMTIPQSGTYGVMRGMGGRSLYAVDFEENAKILKNFLYGTVEGTVET